MKLPIIRHLYKNANQEQLEAGLALLETISEARGLTSHELEVVGEMITNICGAMEVSKSIESGMKETDALNEFAKRVSTSVDSLD